MITLILHNDGISDPAAAVIRLEGHNGPFLIAFVAGVLANANSVPR